MCTIITVHHTSVINSELYTGLFDYLTGVTSQDDMMPLVVIKLNVDLLWPKVSLKDTRAKTDPHQERSLVYLYDDVIIIGIS